jgi:hypothetical protein
VDEKFGDNGMLPLRFGQNPIGDRSIAVQEDGKLILAGRRKLQESSDFVIVVVRLNPDRTPDTMFGEAIDR